MTREDPPNAYGGWDHDGHPDNEKELAIMQIDATYSPEDNKLRLYASERLSPELYQRVKAAGFSWAPKQDLFVAPMWTPERAALAEELAGEIGDEGTSREERAEERAGRFGEYSEKRADDSRRAAEGVKRLTDGIPMGQPILVGHHSERHARRDAAKIENGMRKAVKMWETAEYWVERAEGALRDAMYKERPDVRARRIKRLEADLRKVTKNRDSQAKIVSAWARVDEPGFLKLKSGGESTHAQRVAYLVAVSGGYYSFALADFPRPEGASVYEGPRSVADALKDGTCSAEWAAEYCQRRAGEELARMGAWFDHYTFRLTYERAMMGESGGTATDNTGPQKGGAVQCWASHRGGWSYVAKVNKVSVSVLRNWGNGGKNFLQIMPFDKCHAVMTAAQVEEARAAGRLVEFSDKTGFQLVEIKPEAPKVDNVCPDGGACPDAECIAERERQGIPTGAAFDVDAMRASLKAGVQVATSPTLYPTPRDLAQRMAELAGVMPGDRILEPSAGTGVLVGAIGGRFHGNAPADRGHVVAVELNHDLAERLRREFPLTEVICGDFLEITTGIGKFDRILMNPPFNGGDDIRHILHARTMLNADGFIVGICAGGPRQQKALEHLCDLWEPLPPGTFEAAGTSVNTVLFTMHAEGLE